MKQNLAISHSDTNNLLKQARLLISQYLSAVNKINNKEEQIIDSALAKERQEHISALKQHIQEL